MMRAEPSSITAALAWLREFTDYEQVTPPDARRTFDLGRMRRLLAALGDPHIGRPAIHVTGTKGKGSVVLFADAVLRAHGVRTFRFLSPHVERINERIGIGGVDVGDDHLGDTLLSLRPRVDALRAAMPDDPPTFFEVLTAAGFILARVQGVAADVVEVGLGGRFDATNVIDPTVSVVTSIDLDHVNILGATHDAIALEKGGIIKPERPVLLGIAPGDPGFAVLQERARAMAAPASYPGRGIVVGPVAFARTESGAPGVRFEGAVLDLRVEGAVVPGGAMHQAVNALLALGAARLVVAALGHRFDLPKALAAIATPILPARAELFDGAPPVLLDGAHTGQSCAALCGLARWHFAGRKLVLLAGLTRERSVEALFSPFLKAAPDAVFAPIPSPRSTDPKDAAAHWTTLGGRAHSAANPIEGLARARALAGADGAVVVAGSFYLAGALRAALRELPSRAAPP